MRRLKPELDRASERIVWREILRSAESRYTHRLHGILAVCRGLSCYEAAAVWGRSPRAVEYWVKKYINNGISGLREKGRPGRPRSLSEAQLALLKSDILRGPDAVGLEGGRWTGRLLQRYLQKSFVIQVGVRQCQRLIRRFEAAGGGPDEADYGAQKIKS